MDTDTGSFTHSKDNNKYFNYTCMTFFQVRRDHHASTTSPWLDFLSPSSFHLHSCCVGKNAGPVITVNTRPHLLQSPLCRWLWSQWSLRYQVIECRHYHQSTCTLAITHCHSVHANLYRRAASFKDHCNNAPSPHLSQVGTTKICQLMTEYLSVRSGNLPFLLPVQHMCPHWTGRKD